MMHKKPVVHLSQSNRCLTKLLRDNLFKRGQSLGEKKYIFLPNLTLKNSLLTSFCEDGGVDVVMGLDFLELGEGLQKLFKMCTGKTLLFPPLDLLTLQLETLLEKPGLAPKLAVEFIRYGKFGGQFLKQWSHHWQKEVWDQIFSKWNYPYELLDTTLKKPKEVVEVHLFNFPFLPKLYHLFFDRLAKYIPVNYYQFSPCLEFWSDTVNDYEKMALLEKDQQLSLYLDQGHPILSNFGKVGRETFRVFEEEDFVLEDHYEEKEGKDALASMQYGILHFEKTTPQQDQSFLLLPAPSKLREVEILFARLLEMDVKPTDIQVFAPEIAKYAPLIETVFGADDSPFPCAIYDLPEQPILQTFFELLSLDRFEKEALYKLFTSPYFSPLSQNEAVEFFSWINRSGVKWGVDQAHRKTILPDLLEETESGTWKEAFDALLKNLVFVPEKGTDWDLPYLDFSNAELFGRAITLVESLRKDIDCLKSASLPGEKWAEHLTRIFNHYLAVEKGAYSTIQEKLSFLKDLEGMFTLPSIKRYLGNSLKQKKGIRGTRNLEVVTFRSLRPGTVISSKVIAVLGMNEGDFPRPFVASSLNLLGKESDYAPSSPDEDRYLFLELLMNAGEKLMVTYQNVSDEDGRERPPSVLVQELDPLIVADPPFPFHRDYFSKERVYPMRHFLAAQKFYSADKKEPFIPEYLHKTALPNPQKMERPTFQDLSRFAKNPIRFYCNQVLNLYLHFEDNTDEEFFLSPLQKHKLMQEERGYQLAAKSGQVPLGRFKEVAEKKILEEWEGVMLFDTTSYPLKNIEGIVDIAEEGFPFMGTAKLHDLIKVYPLYIALCAEKPMPLLPLKGSEPLMLKSDPQKAFEDYLHYYSVAIQTPSPLHPYFAPALLEKDSAAFASRIKNTSIDAYFYKVFGDPSAYDTDVVFDTWAPLLRQTFAPLLEMIT